MSGPTAAGTDVDALFRLPLGEFTSARNALAAQLKKAGRQAEADEAKALAKPSVSAWVVNQLYWRHRELFDQLIEAGDRLRRAQGAQFTADSAREPVNARREALTALAAIAADFLHDGDYSATRDMLRRITSTLEALSSYGSLPNAPAAGRLTDDVEPPGFEALAGFLTGSDKRVSGDTRARATSPRTTPERRANKRDTAAHHDDAERKGRLAAAKAAVRDAEGALRDARKQAERAAATRDAAAARARATEKHRAEIEARLARVSKDAKEARELGAEAAANASKATAAAEGAERALDVARRRLKQIAVD